MGGILHRAFLLAPLSPSINRPRRDHRVNLRHQADRLLQGDDDFLIMLDLAVGEFAPFAILERKRVRESPSTLVFPPSWPQAPLLAQIDRDGTRFRGCVAR